MFQHFIEVRQTFDMDVINVEDKMGRKILFTYYSEFQTIPETEIYCRCGRLA